MTKAERLFSLLTEVDDVLVEEAAQPFFPVPEKKHWGRWAALAACLLLVFGLARTFPFIGMGGSAADGEPMAPSQGAPAESAPAVLSFSFNESADPGEVPPEASESAGDVGNTLPILSAPGQFAEGSGGSGIWIDDVTSYISNGFSPDTVGDTLPVYASTLPLDENGTPTASDAANEALLSDVLSRFGLEPEDCTITNIGYLTAITSNGTEISVRDNLVVFVSIPTDGLSDTIRATDNSSFDSMNTLGKAIIDELGWLLNMETPTTCVTGGDVNLYGEKLFYLTIYDGNPSDMTAPIAYVFDALDDTLVIRLDKRTNRELTGEYPIIPLEEAEEQLLTGSWVGYNENWYAIPTAEQILRSELVYCTNIDGYTMPYYRFYLNLGETIELCEPNTQLPTGKVVPQIAFYYVPAVEAQYLTPGSTPVGNQ